MPTSVAEFVKAAEVSGILTADVLAEYAQGDTPDSDAGALAGRLVKAGRLTAFQAKHIYGGKAGSLVLGPYVVLDLLGKGGMGSVYKAAHRKMRRVVALKVIAKAALKNPAAVQRFEREVQAAARLEHPNIVTAFDAGEAGGTHYLVMQFVDGRNLMEVVRAVGPQTVGRAVDWVLQAARGLAYAHGKGVVHRDIKPSNLLVDQDGTVRILDMGLARLETLDADQDQLTGTGQIMGTVDYMAPEQAMDTRQADARSDIYSLGVTLWYLLTGRPLFTGDTVMTRMMAHQQKGAPALTSVRGDIPPEVEAVFYWMVAKKPADRFQSMQEVIAALQSLPHRATAAEPGIAIGDSAASLGQLGTEATWTLQQPQATAMDGTPARLIAASIDKDMGIRQAPRKQQPSGVSPKRLYLAIGGATVGTLLLVGLNMFPFDGRRDTNPAGRDAESAVVSAAQSASRPDSIASVGGTQPTASPRTEPRSTTPLSPAGPPAPPPPAIAPFDVAQARKHQEAWAKHLGIEVETTNSIGQTLVVIPPGRFSMGEAEKTVDFTLTKPFLLGQTEVTQGQWKELMGKEPWKGQRHTTEGRDVAATFVSWDDAVAFCAKLTEREHGNGRIRRDQEYRLPTEAEWEFACRAGTTTTFSFGGDENRIGDHAWFGGGWKDGPIPGGNTAGEMHAHAVKLKRSNPFGLFDVHGNVWEWVADWCSDYPRNPVIAPQAPSETSERVSRGGSWDSSAADCRGTHCLCFAPSHRYDSLGFRLALSPSGVHPQKAVAGR